MIKESKYCSEVIEKHLNKESVMNKEENEGFKNSTKCWICDNDCVDNDVEVRGDCHVTGKHGGSAHTDCNINIKLDHKSLVEFHGQLSISKFSIR